MPQRIVRTNADPPARAGGRQPNRGSLLARAVTVVYLALGGGAAFAQLLYLPPSEFGKPFPNVPHGTGYPQPMAIFGGEPTYEPFRIFAQSQRYGRIGRAVERLDLLVEDPQRGSPATTYCTATLISEDVIVTNYHCVPGINPEVTIVAAELRMGLHHDPDEPGEAFQIADLRPLDALRDLDFVLLRVRGSPGRTYGYVRLDPRDPRDDEPLFMIHHSLGHPKMITRRNCTIFRSESAASLAGQAGGPNTVRYEPATDVTHRCDAQGGSSGALVFSQIDDRVVGLHFAGTHQRRRIRPRRRRGAPPSCAQRPASSGGTPRMRSMSSSPLAPHAQTDVRASRGRAITPRTEWRALGERRSRGALSPTRSISQRTVGGVLKVVSGT